LVTFFGNPRGAFHGTHVPVEEPSTASLPDSCTAAKNYDHLMSLCAGAYGLTAVVLTKSALAQRLDPTRKKAKQEKRSKKDAERRAASCAIESADS